MPEKKKIQIRIPEGDEDGYVELMIDLATFRAQVKELDIIRDPAFWVEFAKFAERFIVDPGGYKDAADAAKHLSRNDVDTIIDYLQTGGKEAKPPLSSAPSSPNSTEGKP